MDQSWIKAAVWPMHRYRGVGYAKARRRTARLFVRWASQETTLRHGLCGEWPSSHDAQHPRHERLTSCCLIVQEHSGHYTANSSCEPQLYRRNRSVGRFRPWSCPPQRSLG